jgi:hypothetical protein
MLEHDPEKWKPVLGKGDWRRVIAAGQFTKMVKGGFCSASSWVSGWESSFDRPMTGWL